MTARDRNEQSEPDEGKGGPEDGADEFIAAEGPDIETSFSDVDEAFLADLAAGNVSGGQPEPAASAQPASEHLEDLRRVTAEYANYRRRVEREQVTVKERAVGDAVRAILPVLDDLDRAEKHGDLPDGAVVTTIAQKLRAGVSKLGVEPYGEAGETFDPRLHDAIFQRQSADVTVPTVADVVERGYRTGDTVLRVAKVVVDSPELG